MNVHRLRDLCWNTIFLSDSCIEQIEKDIIPVDLRRFYKSIVMTDTNFQKGGLLIDAICKNDLERLKYLHEVVGVKYERGWGCPFGNSLHTNNLNLIKYVNETCKLDKGWEFQRNAVMLVINKTKDLEVVKYVVEVMCKDLEISRDHPPDILVKYAIAYGTFEIFEYLFEYFGQKDNYYHASYIKSCPSITDEIREYIDEAIKKSNINTIRSYIKK